MKRGFSGSEPSVEVQKAVGGWAHLLNAKGEHRPPPGAEMRKRARRAEGKVESEFKAAKGEKGGDQLL
jgi:hypothetical protein